MKPAEHPVHAPSMPWIPLREGLSFRPLRFGLDGWALHLRLEPGTTIARHRHTGEVHAYNLSGRRELIETGEIVGPDTYVYEPPGNVDSWRCYGDEPCIVHVSLTGRVEYLDETGNVLHYSDTHKSRAAYLDWCRKNGVVPNVPMAPYPNERVA
ncbi:MAG: cupin domain-containing protein [Rhodospirillales bacterium]|nr:cupin domain-containing protein [Rhodospirillales bacterium]